MRAMHLIRAGMAAAFAAGALLIQPAPAVAQRAAGGPPDWPCVQRLVPELSWRSIWRGPPIDALEQNWWNDAEIGRLVRFSTARTTEQGDAVARVQAFAGQADKQALTLLFAGLFERISEERASSIDAIRRYARGQVRQLEVIGKLVDQLDEARVQQDAARALRLEQELALEKRLFDTRQAMQSALCEQPYLLEERLSRLVRAMGQRL